MHVYMYVPAQIIQQKVVSTQKIDCPELGFDLRLFYNETILRYKMNTKPHIISEIKSEVLIYFIVTSILKIFSCLLYLYFLKAAMCRVKEVDLSLLVTDPQLVVSKTHVHSIALHL